MSEKLLQILDESIRLELSVANLYKIFSSFFQEYRGFWWRLVIEEQNHAALLRSVKECFIPINMIPTGLLSPDLQLLKDTNKTIERMVEKYKTDHLSLEEAFNIAYKLEKCAGEIHYQTYMEKKDEPRVEKIFQELNGDDKDHAMRILLQMNVCHKDGYMR